MRPLLASLCLVLLAACDSAGPGPGPDPMDGTVTEYFQALPGWSQFRPDVAEQAPTPSGPPVAETPVTLDVTTLDEDGNEVISEDVTYTCTSTPYTLAQTPQKIVIYDPDRSVLYPGAFVQGKSYVRGSVDALTIPERTPLRISIPDISSTTGANFRTVTPNQAEVENARGDIIGNAVLDGLATPSAIEFKMETYHSESQFALQARLSGNYLGFSGSAGADVSRDASETTVAVQFTQRMYTVAVERPASDPASFFTEAFTPARLDALVARGQIGADNLPVYVSEVVYGRMMMFTLTSTESESDIRATLQAAYQGIGGSVEGSLSVRQRTLLQNSKVTVTSYGGNADATLAIIRSGDWAQYFTEDAPLSSASPLSYTFRNVGDNSIAAVTEATDYDVRTCDATQATPGTFDLRSPQTLVLPFAPNPTGRAVADVNGDGIDDLVFARWNASENVATAALGNGDGTFSLGATMAAPTGGWQAYRFRVGDIDGDGDADLVWVEPGAQDLTVTVATWTGGGFQLREPLVKTGTPGWNTGYEPALADVDGDGADDLIMNRANSQNRVWVLFAKRDGTFDFANADGQTLTTGGGWDTYTLFPMDFSGDGRADLVWDQANADRHIIHRVTARSARTPSAPFNALPAFLNFGGIAGWGTYADLRTVGQFDGAAGEDFAYPNAAANRVYFAFGRGGTFETSTASTRQDMSLRAAGDPLITHALAVNVNGDAIDDLVLNALDGTVNKTFVLLGQPGGRFDETTRVPQTHPQMGFAWGGYQPFAGRFDSDARDDIVWLSTESTNRVFVGLARE